MCRGAGQVELAGFAGWRWRRRRSGAGADIERRGSAGRSALAIDADRAGAAGCPRRARGAPEEGVPVGGNGSSVRGWPSGIAPPTIMRSRNGCRSAAGPRRGGRRCARSGNPGAARFGGIVAAHIARMGGLAFVDHRASPFVFGPLGPHPEERRRRVSKDVQVVPEPPEAPFETAAGAASSGTRARRRRRSQLVGLLGQAIGEVMGEFTASSSSSRCSATSLAR